MRDPFGKAHPSEAWPFDMGGLQRGSRVDSSVVESAYGAQVGTQEYALAALQARELIQRYFEVERHEVVSVRVESRSGDILVLDHEEQSVYTEAGKKRAIRQFARRHYEDLGVDAAKLSDEERARRDRRILVDSWKLQQLRKHKVPEIGTGKGGGRLPSGRR